MLEIKDIYNSILQGDCVEILKEIPNNSIDMIFADPPYFMQTDGVLLRTDGSKFNGVEDKWDKFSGYNEYDQFCYNWLKECYRVLKDNGSIWVIGSFQNIYRIGYIMQNIGYWILNDIIWSKPNAVPNFSGSRFQNSHETLLWCTKNKNSKFTFNYKTMKYLNGDKQDKSVWDISICIGQERIKDDEGKKVHSTQKPEKLLYKVVLSSTKPNDIVLDPFFGTGTTGAIAKKLGRKYIGIEKEIKYINVAKERLNEIEIKPTDIENLVLEVKPPKVGMEKLIEKNYLIVGENLFDKHGNNSGRLLENGFVSDGQEELSIHKMSAKILHLTNNNGWNFFYIKRDMKLISIDTLRYQYNEEVKNG